MKKIFAILFLAAIVSCSKTPSVTEETHKDKLAFSQNELTIYAGESADVPASYQKWDRGVYVKSEYDFASNPLGVTFTSSVSGVVEITSEGKISGLAAGETVLKMSSDKIDCSGSLAVTVKPAQDPTVKHFTQDLTQPLTADMIVLPLGLTATTMQGLDIDRRGVCYMSWEGSNAMMVRAFNKDGSTIGSDMTLPSGGHGDGFCIEYGADETLFWTSGTLDEHADNGGYSGGKANGTDIRLICCHKFQGGKTEYAEEAYERYYLNDNGCRIVDVDTEHDVMACWTYEDSKDYIYVYKFSEVRALTETLTFTVTRKSHNQGESVKARDLRTLTPLGRYSWVRKGTCTGSTNSGAVQGFCVYEDKVYVNSGAKGDDATLISVLDFSGNILQKLVPMGVTTDKQKLIDLNLSSDGTFEPEGIHIHEGVMYMGFVGDYPTSGSKKHACILKLK